MNAREQYEEYKRLEAEYLAARCEDSCCGSRPRSDYGFAERLTPYDRWWMEQLKIKETK